MSPSLFNKRSWAERYARRFLKTDPGAREVHFLPGGAAEREIRLVVVNEPMEERDEDPLEPIDFGVDMRGPDEHTLFVLDIVPSQWERLKEGRLKLPKDWSLEGEEIYQRSQAIPA